MTVTNIDQKIAIQEAGLGVGWLPLPRIREALVAGRLVTKAVHEPRPPIAIHLARHSEDKGKALMWFWNRLSEDQSLSKWLKPADS